MGNYGAKTSTPGYDIKSVIDYLQLFNSSWPLLKVNQTGTYNGSVSHGLGYPPFHLILRSDGRIDQLAGLSDNYGVDSSTMVRATGVGTPRYYICRLSLTSNYEAPILLGATVQTAVDRDYGFKVARTGKDVRSEDMRDFAINSSARSPMLQKVQEQQMGVGPSGWETVIPHGLPYIPEVFAFIKPCTNVLGLDTTRYCILPPPIGTTGAFYQVDSTNITITADSGFFVGPDIPRVSVVVLKDPLAKQSINISYP